MYKIYSLNLKILYYNNDKMSTVIYITKSP